MKENEYHYCELMWLCWNSYLWEIIMQSKGKFSKLSAHIGEVNILKYSRNWHKIITINQSINQGNACAVHLQICVVFIDDLTIQHNSNCVLQWRRYRYSLVTNFRYIHIVKSEQIFANKRTDRGHVFFRNLPHHLWLNLVCRSRS